GAVREGIGECDTGSHIERNTQCQSEPEHEQSSGTGQVEANSPREGIARRTARVRWRCQRRKAALAEPGIGPVAFMRRTTAGRAERTAGAGMSVTWTQLNG